MPIIIDISLKFHYIKLNFPYPLHYLNIITIINFYCHYYCYCFINATVIITFIIITNNSSTTITISYTAINISTYNNFTLINFDLYACVNHLIDCFNYFKLNSINYVNLVSSTIIINFINYNQTC